jgi:hypothetical protein
MKSTNASLKSGIHRALTFCAVMVLLSTIHSQLSTLRAQGGLTPPGAPAPTMKTLAQIEPRTPIASLPVTITNPGSYYLTTNATFTSFGIRVRTNDVSLDLNGFTITGDGGTTDFGVDIDPTSRISGVSVRNGKFRNMGGGVMVRGSGADDVVVEGLQMQTIVQTGIYLSEGCAGAVIRDNLLVDCGNAIRIAAGASNTISGVTIANNRISAGSGAGIEIVAVSSGIVRGVSVLNNQLAGTGGTAILIVPVAGGSTQRLLVDGNHCVRDSGAGISVPNNTAATVIRNVLTGCTLSVGTTSNTIGPTITSLGILGTNGPAISPWANFQN